MTVYCERLHSLTTAATATTASAGPRPLGRSFGLALLLLGCTAAAQAAIPASERAVLTSLYTSTNGASWKNKTNWNGAAGTECSWYGVQCDSAQSHVTGIQLGSAISGNNLAGKLPALSGLTALEQFDVSFNQLTGAIPALSTLKALKTFYVVANGLTGSIPALSGLTALQAFGVDSNELTGSIPALSGLTALQSFSASDNKLSGAIPSLSGLSALQQFDVGTNALTGAIPALSGLTALKAFYVDSNKLSGAIPSLSGLTSLQDVRANDNLLSGAVGAASAGLLAGQSNLCNNNLVSSGNAATDAAWISAQDPGAGGAAGSNWVACQLGTAALIGVSTDTVAAPSAVQSSYTIKTGAMAAAAVTVEATGSLGAASISVHIDLSKAVPATAAADSTYLVYALAMVPGRQLGTSGIFWYANVGNLGWKALTVPFDTFAQGVPLGSAGQTLAIEIVRDTDITTLLGTEIYVGFGTSEAEMLAASRYRAVYKVQ